MMLSMRKKKLGINAIERDWSWARELTRRFKISSTLIIPDDCKRIGIAAFAGCRNLRKVVIPKSVEWIDYDAFWGCEEATIILKKHKKDFKRIGNCALNGVRDVKEEVRN